MNDETDSRDDGRDTRWMSYAELGQLRGTSAATARRMANRKHWRKQAGNDGTIRVAVPANVPAARETVHETGRETVSFHARALAALETALTAANGRADAALALADRTLAQLANAETRTDAAIQRAERAEAAINGERVRAEMLRTLLDETAASEKQARAEVHEATARAERAEGERDMARADHQKAVETIQRLEDAAARLSKAEAEAAAAGTRAEQAEHAHGSEVAGLRVRADEAVAKAERAEGERDAAREAHVKAMQANRKWEAADAARKARGRLRRAWDGWRGR